MAGDGIKVGYEGLSTAAANFDQRVQDLEGILQQVTSAVSNLQSEWQSNGAVSFESAMSKWNNDVRQVNSTLEEISRNVKQSNQVYQSVDASIQKSFGGFS